MTYNKIIFLSDFKEKYPQFLSSQEECKLRFQKNLLCKNVRYCPFESNLFGKTELIDHIQFIRYFYKNIYILYNDLYETDFDDNTIKVETLRKEITNTDKPYVITYQPTLVSIICEGQVFT